MSAREGPEDSPLDASCVQRGQRLSVIGVGTSSQTSGWVQQVFDLELRCSLMRSRVRIIRLAAGGVQLFGVRCPVSGVSEADDAIASGGDGEPLALG